MRKRIAKLSFIFFVALLLIPIANAQAAINHLFDFTSITPSTMGGDIPNSDYPYKGVKFTPSQDFTFNLMPAAVYAQNGSYSNTPLIQFCLYSLSGNNLDTLIQCSKNLFSWDELNHGSQNNVAFLFDEYELASTTSYGLVYGADTYDPTTETSHIGIMFRYPNSVSGNTSCAWYPNKTALGCFSNQSSIYAVSHIEGYSLPMDVNDMATSTPTAWFDHDDSSISKVRYDGGTSFEYEGHHGTDYFTGTGVEEKPILAAADGIVREARWEDPYDVNEGYGYFVSVYHPENGQRTLYAHATTTQLFVSANDEVIRGEKILLSGDTGMSTGPHLHFGVFDDDTISPTDAIDPYGWSGGGSDPRTNNVGYLWATNPPSNLYNI
ncbi:MAG TPA: M23 family metallopeptidase [Candidatus Paceibacterota bacterium]|nr:M23 family metallopeptidase [Candidatus Paceibacterota bacterium]